MEHMSMEVAPRWNPIEGWFKKDMVQPMAAWAEFTPYLASVAVMGPPKRDGVLDGGVQQGAVDSQEPGRTLKIFTIASGRWLKAPVRIEPRINSVLWYHLVGAREGLPSSGVARQQATGPY